MTSTPSEGPVNTEPTKNNRFSGWATDLIVERLRDTAADEDAMASDDLLLAAADRLDALYYGEANSYQRPLSDERRDQVLQGFIGFLGSGENSRGRFPLTLTELSDDARDYVNIGKPSEGPPPCKCGPEAE